MHRQSPRRRKVAADGESHLRALGVNGMGSGRAVMRPDIADMQDQVYPPAVGYGRAGILAAMWNGVRPRPHQARPEYLFPQCDRHATVLPITPFVVVVGHERR